LSPNIKTPIQAEWGSKQKIAVPICLHSSRLKYGKQTKLKKKNNIFKILIIYEGTEKPI
jgi:hypothetical protein